MAETQLVGQPTSEIKRKAIEHISIIRREPEEEEGPQWPKIEWMSAVHAMASQRKHDNNGRGGTETKCCGHRHARTIARNTKKKCSAEWEEEGGKKRSCENRIMVSVTEPLYRYLMSVLRVACCHRRTNVLSSPCIFIYSICSQRPIPLSPVIHWCLLFF